MVGSPAVDEVEQICFRSAIDCLESDLDHVQLTPFPENVAQTPPTPHFDRMIARLLSSRTLQSPVP